MKKIEEKLDKIVRRLKDYPLTTLLITFLLIFLLPILLTQTFSWVDFSKTGTIGDTIGGITTPFISVMAAILVYYSFRQQIIANKILADQRQDDRKYDNAMFLLKNLQKTLENFSSHDRQIAGTEKGKQSIVILSQMMFNDFGGFRTINWKTDEEKNERLELIQRNINNSIGVNELTRIAIQIDSFLIEIRKSYEQPDDLEAMNTLGYFLEVYGFLHNEYVQPSHNYIVAEFNNRGYQQVPDNLLSNLIDRLNNIRDIILQLSSSGQFRTRERAN